MKCHLVKSAGSLEKITWHLKTLSWFLSGFWSRKKTNFLKAFYLLLQSYKLTRTFNDSVWKTSSGLFSINSWSRCTAGPELFPVVDETKLCLQSVAQGTFRNAIMSCPALFLCSMFALSRWFVTETAPWCFSMHRAIIQEEE